MIVAKNDSMGIPLYWELLDNKSGNSSSEDRIALLAKVINILGKERIAVVVGDREFIGIKWIKYLKSNNIPFCMRVPKGHWITLKDGNSYSIEALLKTSTERYFQDTMVDGVWCNTMLKRLDKNEYLFLIGSFPAKQLGGFYRSRWCIETMFQAFKKRGFDLESTHLKCSKKLSKLLVFVSLALAAGVKFGEQYHKKVQSIKIKKHGYKANSFFRVGLNLIRRGLKNTSQAFVQLWREYIATFSRWMEIQLSYRQTFIKMFG
jgi:transposase